MAAGWSPIWIGPKDYRCEICHCGFTYDQIVYIEKDGLPFHKECVEPIEFRNRMRRGVSVVYPSERISKSEGK